MHFKECCSSSSPLSSSLPVPYKSTPRDQTKGKSQARAPFGEGAALHPCSCCKLLGRYPCEKVCQNIHGAPTVPRNVYGGKTVCARVRVCACARVSRARARVKVAKRMTGKLLRRTRDMSKRSGHASVERQTC